MNVETLQAITQMLQGLTDGAFWGFIVYLGVEVVLSLITATVILTIVWIIVKTVYKLFDETAMLKQLRYEMDIKAAGEFNSYDFERMISWVRNRKK